jgi:hypothetical protein
MLRIRLKAMARVSALVTVGGAVMGTGSLAGALRT